MRIASNASLSQWAGSTGCHNQPQGSTPSPFGVIIDSLAANAVPTYGERRLHFPGSQRAWGKGETWLPNPATLSGHDSILATTNSIIGHAAEGNVPVKLGCSSGKGTPESDRLKCMMHFF